MQSGDLEWSACMSAIRGDIIVKSVDESRVLMMDMPLPPEVAERIGPYYVYVLVDPRDDSIFYVGKDTGQRLLAHGHEALLKAGPRSRKIARINEIRASGNEPRIDVVRHGLDEEAALMVEAALIDCVDGLTNKARRSSLKELVTRYGTPPVGPDSNTTIRSSLASPVAPPVGFGAPPAVLIRLKPWEDRRDGIEPGVIRLGHGYREGMSLQDLVDSTRAWWRISPDTVKQRGIRHAVAVHKGVTRCVMTIGNWIQCGDGGWAHGRWAFAATPLTHGPVFDEWVGSLGKRVYFKRGSQNPVTYWPQK